MTNQAEREHIPAVRVGAEPRIMFVLGTTSAGGGENQCRYLLDALREHRVRLELVCFRPGAAHEQFEALEIPLHIVTAKMPVTLDWYRRAKYLRRLIDRDPPDVLHTWLYEAHHVGLVASRSWPATRVLLSHRGSSILPGDRKFIAALRVLRRRIDHVVPNSDAGAAMIARRVGIAADRISVIPNGIPRGRIALGRPREEIRRQLGLQAGAPVVCSVGRIDHQGAKDYKTLFAAMKAVWSVRPETELIILGPLTDQLEDELGSKLPPQVRVVGWQPQPSEWMNASDVVAVHSRTEGYSNVAGEALMLGLPVAATNTGGHPILVQRSGGRVVPVGDGEAFGRAILDLLRSPPSRTTVLEVAHDALSMDRAAEAYLGVYDRLLAEPRTAAAQVAR